VWIKPIVGGLEHNSRRHEDSFVTRAADLKEDSILPLELNLFVVETSRQIHRAIHLDQQLVIRQLFMGSCRRLALAHELQNFSISSHYFPMISFAIVWSCMFDVPS